MKLAARIAMGVLAVVAVAAVGFGVLYTSRIQTANSIEKLTDYDDYNLYRMQVRYDYDLDNMSPTPRRITKALLMQPSSRRCRCCPSPSKRLPSAAAPSTSRRPAATT